MVLDSHRKLKKIYHRTISLKQYPIIFLRTQQKRATKGKANATNNAISPDEFNSFFWDFAFPKLIHIIYF